MIIETKMATTQPIFKLGCPDFAWYYIYVIPNKNDDDSDDDDEKPK